MWKSLPTRTFVNSIRYLLLLQSNKFLASFNDGRPEKSAGYFRLGLTRLADLTRVVLEDIHLDQPEHLLRL